MTQFNLPNSVTSAITAAYNSGEEFAYNLREAFEWLGFSTYGHCVTSFKNAGFLTGSDFTGIRKFTGAREREDFMLTADCFKSFCMMIRTERGKQVRAYFLHVEKEYAKVIKQAPVKTLTDREVLEVAMKALDERLQQERFCDDKPGLLNIIRQASASHKHLAPAALPLADICSTHFDVELTSGQLSSLGRYVAGEYKAWHRQEPPKELADVGGTQRRVSVYTSVMYPTIENWLRHEGRLN